MHAIAEADKRFFKKGGRSALVGTERCEGIKFTMFSDNVNVHNYECVRGRSGCPDFVILGETTFIFHDIMISYIF